MPDKTAMRLILSYWQPAVDHGDLPSQERILSLLAGTAAVSESELRQYLDASKLHFEMEQEIHKLEQLPGTAMSVTVMRSALASYENTLRDFDRRCAVALQPAGPLAADTGPAGKPEPAEEPLPEHVAARHRLWDDDFC